MYKTSVILPCYNGAHWIDRSIESVLVQTCRNFELLVIDDGSTDNSKEIVASHLSDGRVRYIYQENRGFSAAINRGIKESNGGLIGFIGQDDLWLPNKLKIQVKYFSEHEDVDAVHSDYDTINSEGQTTRLRDTKIQSFSSRKNLIEHLFINNFMGFETVLVKKECFDEVGFFDERMMGFSDHDMWLRIAGKFNIDYIDLPLVKKREHALQFTKTSIEQGLRDEFLLVDKAVHQYPFLRKTEQKKLASLHYALGTVMLQKGNKEKARQEFFLSFRCRPWKAKALIAYIAPTLYRFTWDRYRQSKPMLHRGMRWIEG